jgi:phosphatidylglycerophosphate synthase
MLTPANVVTMLRVAMFLGVVCLMLLKPANYAIWSAGLFIASYVASVIDGMLARNRGEATLFGQLLDSYMNKISVVGLMILLLNANVSPALVVLLMSGRELFAGLVRQMAHERGILLPNFPLTQLKTAMHFLGITCLILSIDFGSELKSVGLALMITSIAMAWTSAFFYTRYLFRVMRRREEL